ncbi:MAG: 3-hydroxyacyl-[acyl-carrier-protein] dehydratase FabZ [Candidatus Omnitrophota bacterium]|nr:MAG: 3-hydroxyacyl-[acyl-carrier-protein] dehydratase FabZ [Candidatus Omnitrophota bacterium]
MERQKTIAKQVTLEGIGLHTANKVNLNFKPAPEDSGIRFIRTDLANKPVIKTCVENLLDPYQRIRRTSIGKDGVEIQTVEHLLAALAGMNIDNLDIEINNQEVPGADGSSIEFAEIISRAGIKEQDKERNYFSIKEPIFAQEEQASIVILPAKDFTISYTLSYNHPLLKVQFLEINMDREKFKENLAGARTFCLESEVGNLQEQGIGLGASYSNTLVVGKEGVINNKLRFEDEFIRHKILDLVGDLYILGQPLKGHIIALKSGHSLNLKMLKKIHQQRERYLLGGVGVDSRPNDEHELDREAIMKILPHRPPFLFVDRILSLEQGKHARGIKYVTKDDYYFKGHFPQKPVMPGVLMIEAMAQVGGVMMLAAKENRGKLAYFLAANNVKFRKTVVPGDDLVLDVTAVRVKSKTGTVHAKALVEGKVVAEADLMFTLSEE